MISPGENVLVAFSGGPDSTALLHILHRLAERIDFSLHACYLNHHLRPRTALKESRFCADFCRRKKIPFLADDIDVPALADRDRLSIETAGHIYRRKKLAEIARTTGCTKIALGHHLDDRVESILFRLFRGTGPGGLQPIKPVAGNIIRPLYNLEKREIEQYLNRAGIDFLIDKSNLKSKYSRNYIRNRLLPLLEKHFGGKFKKSLLHFSDITASENEYLRQIALREAKKISRRTPGGKIIVDLAKMQSYDIWLRRRTIKYFLEMLCGHPGAGTYDEIERVDKLINGDLNEICLSAKTTASAERDCLIFMREPINIRKQTFNIGREIKMPEIRAKIRCREKTVAPDSATPTGNGLKISLGREHIHPPLTIRNIRNGDRFTPLGMKGTKKVGDFLTDRKVSRYVRDEIPVILDQKGILWLVGHQIDNRAKIVETTEKILEIEIIPGKR